MISGRTVVLLARAGVVAIALAVLATLVLSVPHPGTARAETQPSQATAGLLLTMWHDDHAFVVVLAHGAHPTTALHHPSCPCLYGRGYKALPAPKIEGSR